MYPIKSPHSVNDNYRGKTLLIPAINLPVRIYTRTYPYVCVCVRTGRYIYIYTHTHTHTRARARTHTHTHTHLCVYSIYTQEAERMHGKSGKRVFPGHTIEAMVTTDRAPYHRNNPVCPIKAPFPFAITPFQPSAKPSRRAA